MKSLTSIRIDTWILGCECKCVAKIKYQIQISNKIFYESQQRNNLHTLCIITQFITEFVRVRERERKKTICSVQTNRSNMYSAINSENEMAARTDMASLMRHMRISYMYTRHSLSNLQYSYIRDYIALKFWRACLKHTYPIWIQSWGTNSRKKK